MALSNEEIIEAIGQKTVLEVVELIKAMEEKFGRNCRCCCCCRSCCCCRCG